VQGNTKKILFRFHLFDELKKFLRSVWCDFSLGKLIQILIIMVIFLFSTNGIAPAQDAAGTGVTVQELTGSKLSRILQLQAQTALGRYLRPEEFHVFAKVEPQSTSQNALPYLPESLANMPGSEAPIEALQPMIKKVEIEVMIADRHKQSARKKLEAILVKTLGLNPSRGDRVSFTTLGLPSDPPLSETQMDLTRAEAEVRDLKTRLDAAAKELTDAKRDLSQARGEVDRITREKQGGEKNSESSASGGSQKEEFWRAHLTLIVSAFVAIIAIFVGNMAIHGAAKTLGLAVQTIGASIPTLGAKLSESLGQVSALSQPFEGLGAGERRSPERGNGESFGGGGRLPLESVARRVLELHDELRGAVNVNNEGIVLEHLSRLLESQEMIGDAVATMELLGTDKANELFRKLASEHQLKVAAFVRSGVHRGPKGELMVEVGEALKTRLFGAELPSRIKLDPAIRNHLVQMNTEDLLQVVISLEGQHLARLFAYLGSAQLAPVMTVLYKKDRAKFGRVAAAINKIPQVEASVELDSELLKIIVAQISRRTADIQSAYLPYYRALLEAVDDDIAAVMSEQISANNAQVARYLQETVVNFSTFFKLKKEIQEEIIGAMTNRDLAAVYSHLGEDFKVQMYDLLEQRRRELVDEEIQRLGSRGERQSYAAHRLAKKYIVDRIVQIKGSGSLGDILSSQEAAHQKSPSNMEKTTKKVA
jgi:hypothetical protein